MYVKCLALLLLLLVYLAASMGPKTKMSGGEIDVLQVDREAVSLQCHKNLQPLNGARWTKDGGPVDEANERVDTPGSFLTIEPVYPQDEGVYRCNDGEELRLRGIYTYSHIIPHRSYLTSVQFLRMSLARKRS